MQMSEYENTEQSWNYVSAEMGSWKREVEKSWENLYILYAMKHEVIALKM